MATAELGINIVARNQARGVLKGLQGDLKGIQSSLGGVMKIAAGNLIATGISRGIQAVTSGLSSAIDLSAEFNAQMSGIQAILGGTSEDLGKLKKLSLDLGVDPNLKVSAVEAAGAIEMLARNGLKMPAIMDGAAKATILLANATGADFALAADIGTDAMAIFGIEAKNMIDAVDGITSVVNNSKFTIDDYALALAQGGGVAASSGVSFKDYNTYLAGTAQYFKSGSDSGTAFKTMITRLNPQTKAASELMQELGLITKEGQNVFYTSTGALRDYNEIAGVMDKTFSDMTEQQRTNALVTLFGADAYRAAYGTMKLTREGAEALQAVQEDTSALKSSSLRIDNLAGDMEIYRGVVESVTLQMTDAFDPAMRAFYQTATSVLSRLAPAMIKFTGEVGQGINNGIADITAYKNGFSQLFSFFGDDKTSGFLAALGKLTGAKVDVPIGAKIITVDWGLLKTSFDSAKQDLSITIGDFITGTFNLADYTTSLSIGDVFTGSISIKDKIAKLSIGDAFTGSINLKDKIAKISIGDFFASASYGTDGKIKFTFNETNFDVDFGPLQKKIGDGIQSVKDAYTLGGIDGVFTKLSDDLSAALTALPTDIYAGTGGLGGINFSALATRIADQLKALPTTIYTAIGGLTGVDFSALSVRIADNIKGIPAAITAKVGTFGGITKIGEDLSTSLLTIETSLKGFMGEGGTLKATLVIVNGFLTDLTATFANADAKAIGESFSGAITSVLSIFSTLNTVDDAGLAGISDALSGTVTAILGFATEFTAGVNSVAVGDEITKGVGLLIKSFTVAISNPDIEGMAVAASGLIGALAESFKVAFSSDNTTIVGESIGEFARAMMDQISAVLTNPDLASSISGAAVDMAAGLFSALSGALGGVGTALEGSGGIVGVTESAATFVENLLHGLAASLAEADFSEVRQAFVDGVANAGKAAAAVIGVDAESNRDRLRQSAQDLKVATDAAQQVQDDYNAGLISSVEAQRRDLQVVGAQTAAENTQLRNNFFALATEVPGILGGMFTDLKTLFTDPASLFTPSVAQGAAGNQSAFGTSVVQFTGDTDIKAAIGPAVAALNGFTQSVLDAQSRIGAEGPQTAEELGFNQAGFTQAQKSVEEFGLASSQQATFLTSFGVTNAAALTMLPEPAAAASAAFTLAGVNVGVVAETMTALTGPIGLVVQGIAQAATAVYTAVARMRDAAAAAASLAASIRSAAAGAAASSAIPGNAGGTNNWEGGWTWVGEKGPELLNLPKGSQILSNGDSKKMIGQMADGTGLPTGGGGGGFLDSFAQIIGFGLSLLDNSLATATDANTALDESLSLNTEAVEAAAMATQSAQTAANANAGLMATAGDMIRVSAQQFAQAATNSGSVVLNGVAHFTESFSELLGSFGDSLEGALGKVPGLMGTSEVTADQMKLASLGVDQNFADNWVRRLTDEVMNGVDWEGVDIADAAKRAGINPNLPAETILELVKQSWNDKSLFADKANLDLFDMDAIQASLLQQQAQAAGQANVLALFGITPEKATASGVAAGTSMRSGVATGLTAATGDSDLGASLATGITDGMTPEDFAIIGTTAVESITAELSKPEYAQAMLQSVIGLFSGVKSSTDEFIDIARDMANQIAGALGSVTDVDMVGKLASSMRSNLALEESISTLKDIGERILEYVFQGYSDAAKGKDWAYATVGSAPEGNTTQVGSNAAGTRNWRGGLSWVGERGAELVELPRGSNVYSNKASMAMAGAGGGVNVTVNVASVSDNLDMERLAHKIADVIQRRRH